MVMSVSWFSIQVLNAGWQEGLEVACENALPRYDWAAFDQVVANARPDGINLQGPPKRRISVFTFLRLGPDLLQERNWSEFVHFVRAMHAGMDYHPEPEQFWKPRSLVRHSKPVQALPPDEVPTPVASVPLNVSAMPLAPAPESEPFFSSDAPGGGLGVQVGEIPFGRGSVAGTSFPSSPVTDAASPSTGSMGPEAAGSAAFGLIDDQERLVSSLAVPDVRGRGAAGITGKEAEGATLDRREGPESSWGRQDGGQGGSQSSGECREESGNNSNEPSQPPESQWQKPGRDGRAVEDTAYRETTSFGGDASSSEQVGGELEARWFRQGGEGTAERGEGPKAILGPREAQNAVGEALTEGGGGLLATLVSLFQNTPP
eukprot:TRINITY_DN1517_c0_g1_i2.p1 TRINITY_DN1517_c0_g1~~TRINITY_DN1517_c0_g1_i2.p1  ORF type:complete len:374 (-),score=62.95 TRINITY_DN1517_c0_g1_i2:1694-2815(-)